MMGKKAICISASNKMNDGEQKASYIICRRIQEMLAKERVCCQIIDIGEFDLKPCMGCGQCAKSGKCMVDKDFNRIYESVGRADWCFIVSSHYAPIPVGLCILLGKLEQMNIYFRQGRAGSEPDLEGKLAGIVSCGGREGWELDHCKAMVNDTIANTLCTLQMRVVPFNSKWDTGIALPVERGCRKSANPYSGKDCEEMDLEERLRRYVEVIVQTSKSLYALR